MAFLSFAMNSRMVELVEAAGQIGTVEGGTIAFGIPILVDDRMPDNVLIELRSQEAQMELLALLSAGIEWLEIEKIMGAREVSK